MPRTVLPARLVLILVLLVSAVSCRPAASTHVLFIGNSYTYYNRGLGRELTSLSPSTATKVIAQPGYTLKNHWDAGQALQAIHKGGWDVVVLQEQSQLPVLDSTQFFNSVRDFDREIRLSGARTVLLMTWERPDSLSGGVTTANLAAAYQSVGRELGLQVAPAGLAFAMSRLERPDLELYSPDGHPTVAGTYLAACVLYGTIFKQTPVGLPYADKGIPAGDRDFLQTVAARTLGY